MPIDFNHKLHQKVTYLGDDQSLRKSSLYVVIKDEFPNMYVMNPDDELVIHIINKHGEVIHNENADMRELYKVTKSELSFQGELYRPKDWQ
jgi:hypothetical protein